MTKDELARVIVTHSRLLRYIAYSLTKNTNDAADLVQSTYLRALLNYEKYTEETNLKAWLTTILKNIFINEYRRNKKSVVDSYADLHLLNVINDKGIYSPDSTYQEKEIMNHINNLDNTIKVPFQMHIDGFKYEEIAETLKIPIGTVKSRIFFARKKLMININLIKLKPMKPEVIQFREIVSKLIEYNIFNKNKIVALSRLPWPTFIQITTSNKEINFTDSTLEKIKVFNKLYENYKIPLIDEKYPEEEKIKKQLYLQESTNKNEFNESIRLIECIKKLAKDLPNNVHLTIN